MMLPVALVSVLAAPLPAADAPPASLAPAPAPVEVAPAPADLAPAPAPVEPVAAPVEPVAPPATVGPASVEPVIIEVQPAEPAPVVIVTPSPEPAPQLTLSPPAPTWGAVPRPVYSPPSEASVRQTMRQHRRGAAAALVVGGLGMAATLGFQSMRIQALQRCAARGGASDTPECFDLQGMEPAFTYYGALGMGMFVVGTAGAGAGLGNAAATRDVQLRHGATRPRNGLKLIGVATIGASVGWMLIANMRLLKLEGQCEGDPHCQLQYRPLRLAANDGGALGVAVGSGMVGYAVAYERQGRALMRLRAAPSLGARHGGVSLAMEF